MAMHYVYILRSESRHRYYIGSTGNLDRRIHQHNSPHRGYTSVGGPWKLIHSEAYATKAEALKREHYLKSIKNVRYIRGLLNPGANILDA